MAAPATQHVWRLMRRPDGDLRDGDLVYSEEAIAPLTDGQVLVEIEYLSLDPTYRIWMADIPQYMPPVKVGAIMRGIGVGVVLESKATKIPVGARIQGMVGWQQFATMRAEDVTMMPPGLPFTAKDYTGLLNHIGATAYFGLVEIGQPKAGETLVVSAAAGAVGSIVGQIGKLLGCRVVGIASTPEKCAWLTDELGFDAAIDRKAEDIGAGLARTCPDGIDVYFDNVGGPILDAVLSRINNYARIPLCGLISTYNRNRPSPGPYHFANLLIRRARLEGFIITDYTSRFPEAFLKLGGWLSEGKLSYKLDEVDGLANAVEGFRRLFTGENTGKLAVRVKP